MSILTLFQTSSIHCLKITFSMISKEMLDKLHEVDNTNSLQNNKSNLCSSINNSKGRCIPY